MTSEPAAADYFTTGAFMQKNMADGSIFDIPKAISRAGLYQSWREKRLWIPKVICVRQISSILLQRDLIFHRSITLKACFSLHQPLNGMQTRAKCVFGLIV